MWHWRWRAAPVQLDLGEALGPLDAVRELAVGDVVRQPAEAEGQGGTDYSTNVPGCEGEGGRFG